MAQILVHAVSMDSCVTACGDCRGESCRNAEEAVFDDTDLDDIGTVSDFI